MEQHFSAAGLGHNRVRLAERFWYWAFTFDVLRQDDVGIVLLKSQARRDRCDIPEYSETFQLTMQKLSAMIRVWVVGGGDRGWRLVGQIEEGVRSDSVGATLAWLT